MRLVIVLEGGLCKRLIADLPNLDVLIVDRDDDAEDPIKLSSCEIEVNAFLTNDIFESLEEQIEALDL